MLRGIMKRLDSDRRGVSNVIVVMLSLILLVVIVTNVIIWSYQMNQFDWERIHEDVQITDVGPLNNSVWFTAQNEFNINVGAHLSGTYLDTQTDNSQYERFTEGSNWWNSSFMYRRQITILNTVSTTLQANYTVSVTTDTASLVSAGKALANGNDLRVVYLSGNSWVELDRNLQDMNTGSTQIWFSTQKSIGPSASDSSYYVYYGNAAASTPPTNLHNVYLWFDDFNRPNESDITAESAYQVKTGGGTWSIENNQLKNIGADGDPNKLIITALGNVSSGVDMLVNIQVVSFAGGDTSRMGLSCCMDTDPSRGSGYCGLFYQDYTGPDLLNDLRSWGTYGTYSWSLNTSYYMRFRINDPSSRSGMVKIWPVRSPEPNAWTLNGSFGTGPARSYGEIGFAGSRTSDTTYFDNITIRYAATSEPSTSLGLEETQANNKLDIANSFLIDLATYPLGRIKTVEVLMKYRTSDAGDTWYLLMHNWTSSVFGSAGFNFTTGVTPTTGWDYYAINLTDQWRSYVNENGTISIEFANQVADSNQTTLDVDFLGVRVSVDGSFFSINNKGSTTAHLVSLWVDNATVHQNYDVNLFINSGGQADYIRLDISLTGTPLVIRVVTDKGSVSVFSLS